MKTDQQLANAIARAAGQSTHHHNSRKAGIMNKTQASTINGGLTQTSKMPCKSYSLPTLACRVGFRLSKIAGSVCSVCYAQKGFYSMYAATVEPAQMARLDSLSNPDWVASMVVSIGTDTLMRWHDSGDLQSVQHLDQIAQVALLTPNCRHWLPTREHAIVAQWVALGNVIPDNLVIRLSAMFPDVAPKVPTALRSVKGITTSFVHRTIPVVQACGAVAGKCGDCRECWGDKPISYKLH